MGTRGTAYSNDVQGRISKLHYARPHDEGPGRAGPLIGELAPPDVELYLGGHSGYSFALYSVEPVLL